MSEPYLGQIQPFAFQFAPRGWLQCNGQVLPVGQYQALFALLGTIYGGTGNTNFNLPNLQGRTLVGSGTYVGTTGTVIYDPGQKGGATTTTLTTAQLPAHTHVAQVTTQGTGTVSVTVNATTADPATTGYSASPSANALLGVVSDAGTGQAATVYAPANTAPTVPLGGVVVSGNPGAVSVANAITGSGQPFTTISPFLTVFMCIATEGVYPTRAS